MNKLVRMKIPSTELHILNGDSAWELWKKFDFRAQSLVWREIYLEGPLPETEDLHSFRTARTEYLSRFQELSGVDKSKLYQYLKKMDESVLNLPENSNLILWFDSCIFDQTLLMRIFYLLCRKFPLTVNVFLYCCDSNSLGINDFENGYSEKVQLFPEDLVAAEKAWLLFQKKDAPGMIRLAEQGNFERMPKMKKALFRCAEEVPDKKGLTRTQRQIIQLVSEGKCTFAEIFKGQAAFEEYPFLGDTGCQRILDDLTGKGFLIQHSGVYSLK